MKLNKYIRNPKHEGITSIYFTIVWCCNRLILQAGESIHTCEWNNKKFEPKQNSDNAMLIGRLTKLEQKIRCAFEKLEDEHGIDSITPIMLKNEILKKSKAKKVEVEKSTKMLFGQLMTSLIDDTKTGRRLSTKKMKIKSGSIKPYGNVKLAFEQFEQASRRKFYLDQINQEVLDKFETYLVEEKKLALNTKTKYLQRFMLAMKYAQQKKLITNEALSNLKITVLREESDNIYLNEEEINEMMDYRNPESPMHEYIRDMFVIGCWSGLRHSDLSMLSQKNFIESRIRTIQQKVGEKVVIPIHPLVKQILAKYPDGLPKCPSSQKFNEYLEDIGKTIPSLQKDFEKRTTREYKVETVIYKRWELLTTHCCRRSFCTNEILYGTNETIIMAISGHKSFATFRAYVKATCDQKADLLQQVWDKRYEK